MNHPENTKSQRERAIGTPKIVLASSSPFRRELLSRLGLPFSTHSPEIDETALPGESAAELVARLSLEKARAVATRFPDALVIGSDQVADHGGQIVGKPGNHEEAVEQLQSASGAVVTLYCGLVLLNSGNGEYQSAVEPFDVEFRHLNRELIEAYLAREQPYQCCGSLKAEGLGIVLLKRLSGDDPSALIGLPLIRLVDMLLEAGVSPLEAPTLPA